ncbi:carboxypeptidase-like regulatory domain-containing protein [Algoriphagus sp. C2-6-M1]|uniref:carboxypeptidase regulatory-like domain-containing protein n=1 Tax=Algoriphagus persicinus TaxID=3108754 RepID=UPI002B3CA3C5|nr:carboxypeptidase regulatory-like domain-containing protein [Algoriphagus sp. C2-6-M1]MEB2781446.1 carboxypeptidase-like regulatory domain-containing protein [Algoriphagus sp. C2-6-M1]
MKYVLILILFFGLRITTAYSQGIEVTGKVVDAISQNPIEFATIKLLNGDSGQMIAGTTTLPNGNLLLSTEIKNFSIEVSFIGFITQQIKEIEVVNNKVNLGTISLEQDTKQMSEVVVRGKDLPLNFN